MAIGKQGVGLPWVQLTQVRSLVPWSSHEHKQALSSWGSLPPTQKCCKSGKKKKKYVVLGTDSRLTAFASSPLVVRALHQYLQFCQTPWCLGKMSFSWLVFPVLDHSLNGSEVVIFHLPYLVLSHLRTFFSFYFSCYLLPHLPRQVLPPKLLTPESFCDTPSSAQGLLQDLHSRTTADFGDIMWCQKAKLD